MSVAAAAERLAEVLAAAPVKLAAISDDEASRRSGPDRWARKEILGHLIDSASNNHQRFVRAQLFPRFEDPGYQQEQWVAAQHYVDEPWPDLVNLWLLLNRHLLHLMRTVDAASLENAIVIGEHEPMPLSHVMIDYVRHLEHHLGQIVGA